jgi:drug/metabolite transporter (DMT)-like permease
MVLSGLMLALHFATWITSLQHTSVGSSVLLVSTQPLFGLWLSRIFLGEAASRRTVIAVGVCLAGTAVIVWGDLGIGPDRRFGDLLALAGAAFAAGYLLIGRRVRAQVPFGTYLTCVYASAAAALGLMMIGAGTPASPARDALWLILMAAGPGVAGHGLLNWCVRRVRAYVVNAALLGEPILATLYAWLVFSERPGLHLLAGGGLVVAGLAFVLHEEGRSPGERREAPAL